MKSEKTKFNLEYKRHEGYFQSLYNILYNLSEISTNFLSYKNQVSIYKFNSVLTTLTYFASCYLPDEVIEDVQKLNKKVLSKDILNIINLTTKTAEMNNTIFGLQEELLKTFQKIMAYLSEADLIPKKIKKLEIDKYVPEDEIEKKEAFRGISRILFE